MKKTASEEAKGRASGLAKMNGRKKRITPRRSTAQDDAARVANAEARLNALQKLSPGDRVKVLAGTDGPHEWGNALGTVAAVHGAAVDVRLDAHAHEPDRVTTFNRSELRASDASDLAR